MADPSPFDPPVRVTEIRMNADDLQALLAENKRLHAALGECQASNTKLVEERREWRKLGGHLLRALEGTDEVAKLTARAALDKAMWGLG